ncbi:hypothetical protein MBLNU459_g3980t1 [Dothideomycetes sp. NU459]
MLSEQFVASISPSATKVNTSTTKDVGVFVFESQPHSSQRAAFKKSSTNPACLAVSASHVYAAQADKAVVHVYNRGKGSQEATIPFPERITCVALACEDTVLVLGSDTGRIFLWETHTGRQVVTSQAHLQTVTSLAVDPRSNFLLSASADSSIHVWSIPALLSFSSSDSQSQNAPLHTLSGHRSAITALVLGHGSSSSNIAVSASRDNSMMIWDYHTATLLRTVLLPSTPLCLAIDPADRAVYTGYDDGSVQIIDFYNPQFSAAEPSSAQNPLYDEAQSNMPVQPAASTRWSPPSQDLGATLSAMLSYDGSILTTGHASGKILTWDIPLARYSSTFTPAPLPGPVTNLLRLPVLGFPSSSHPQNLRQHTIIKPRHGAFDARDAADGAVPGNYTLSAQFSSTLPVPRFSAWEGAEETGEASGLACSTTASAFATALTHPTFPASLLSASLSELASWTNPTASSSSSGPELASSANDDDDKAATAAAADDDDFMALDSPAPAAPAKPTLEQQNASLRAELAALRRVQRASLTQMEALRKEKGQLAERLRRGGEGGEGGKEVEALEKARRGWSRLGREGGGAGDGESE